MKKITVLTPTYNDSKSIEETLMSLINQSYDNWESIIIDDGSTDETKQIIEEFKSKYDKNNKIKYIFQNNQDQLNAITNGLNFASGDYIFVLHSDDLLPDNDFFKRIIKIAEKDCVDAIIGDLEIINEKSQIINCWRALDYRNKKYLPPILLLSQGGNIFGDVGLWKKEIYLSTIKNNYLSWNTPFWIDLNDKPKILDVKTVHFPILKYRIHESNYINDDIGKFNVLNGELRALTTLLNYYKIPLYSIQKAMWNFTRMKGVRKLHLYNHFIPLYLTKPTNNKYKIIKKKITKTYKKGFKNNVFLYSLLEFYRLKSNREIELSNLTNETIYMGKDIRLFTNNLFNNTLPSIYYSLFEEMKKGFNTIIVNSEKERDCAIKLTRFLCIYPYTKIVIKSGG